MKITLDSKDKLYGLAIPGTANSGMSASTTTIVAAELAGFGDDFFNTHYSMQIIKDADGAGSAPEGEIRQVTDYASDSGTFTTDAFSANVEEADEFLLLHNSVVSLLSQETIMGYFSLSDRDDFDVADADADTQRWNPEYISGAAGGSADINTTTAGKLFILADKDAGAERYAVSRNLEMFADFMTITEDVNVTFGTTDGATAKAVGIGVSAGAAYDANNYIFIERQKGTAVDRIQVRSVLNGAGEVTTNVAITDDVVGFKIERWDQVWRLYYSLSQEPNYDWVLVSRIEDPSNFMTNAYTFYQQAFNGSAGDATETAQGDFDNFKYYVGASGGGQYIVGDYNSDHIGSDVDGNVMERQEAVQVGLGVVAGGGTGFEVDGTGHNLFETLVAIDGVTTGAGTTTTFVDTARTEGVDYWNGSLIIPLTGSAAGQVRTIVDDDGTDTLTVEPALAAAPGTPISYVILKQRGADWIIGDNNAANAFDSSAVTADADGSVLERLEVVQASISPTGVGVFQVSATTIDLQQAAASYDLFTGTTQDVVVERLIIRLPNVDVSDDAAITSISILSDDVTPSTFLSTAAGTKANLTAEAQLAANINNGILIKVGTKIRLTIAGGAADAGTVCDVIAHYRSVVAGGTLA